MSDCGKKITFNEQKMKIAFNEHKVNKDSENHQNQRF